LCYQILLFHILKDNEWFVQTQSNECILPLLLAAYQASLPGTMIVHPETGIYHAGASS